MSDWLSMPSLLTAVSLAIMIPLISSDIPLRPRVAGGFLASISDFPALATIRTWDPEKKGFTWCGGAIIDEQWILSVGQCMPQYREGGAVPVPVLQVAVGVDDKRKFHKHRVEVHSFNRHEQFNQSTLVNDIMLIRLVKKLKFSPFIQKLQLPVRDQAYRYTSQDPKVTLAGYGEERMGGNPVDILRIVSFAVLPNADCVYKAGYEKHAHLCAGTIDGTRDVCEGDIGSPISVDSTKTGNATILGLLSHGMNCGMRALSPSVYTRVSHYLDWIHKEMTKDLKEAYGEP